MRIPSFTIQPLRIVLVALAAIATLLASPRTTPAQAPDPEYRGSDEVLVTVEGKPITERDFFIFQSVHEKDPLVARGWKRWADAGDAPRLFQLQSDLDAMIFLRLAATEPGASVVAKGALDQKGSRLLASAIAKVVWMDDVIARRVVVHDEDIAHELRTNWQAYAKPDAVMLEQIRVPIGDKGALAVDAARNRADALREAALTGGGLAAVVAADRSLAPSRDGSRVLLSRDSAEFDPLVLDLVFSMRESEISQPVETAGAFYLFEVIRRYDRQVPTIAEARGRIEEALRMRFLPMQFTYNLAKAARRPPPVNRARMIRNVPGDVEVMRVREFALTRDEFLDLFPEIVGDRSNPRVAAAEAWIGRFVDGELVTQELEKAGGINSPMYARALDISDEIIRAYRYLRERRERVEVTDKEVGEYLTQHRAKLVPQQSREIWRLKIDPRRSREMRFEELETARQVNGSLLRDLAQQAEQQLAERRAIAGDEVLRDPEPVVKNLPALEDDRFRLRLERLGEFDPREADAAFQTPISALQPGQFSRVVPRRDGSVETFYVSGLRPAPELDEKQLLERAREALVTEKVEKTVRDRIDALRAGGRLQYAFKVPAPPAPR